MKIEFFDDRRRRWRIVYITVRNWWGRKTCLRAYWDHNAKWPRLRWIGTGVSVSPRVSQIVREALMGVETFDRREALEEQERLARAEWQA